MDYIICGMTVYQILWYFVIYSFIGWCVEVVYHAMKAHRLVNRGFLDGPVCPVYGFGVLLVFAAVYFVMGQTDNALQNISIPLLFPIGVLMTTSVELLGGWMLDAAFHARWWNYSGEKFNFRGYICLKFSMLWGLGIVFLVKLAHPVIDKNTVSLLPVRIGIWIIGVFIITYLADFIVSVLIMMKLNRELEELDTIQAEMRKISDQLTRVVAGGSIVAEVLVDAGLTKAGLVKEDTMTAVMRQALNAGDVIDPKTYNAEFKESGVPEQAGVQVEADVREALKERREAYTDEFEQRMDNAAAAFAQKTDAAADNLQQTVDALENKLTELRNRSANISAAALHRRVFGPLRILRAFPRMKHERYGDALQSLRSFAAERLGSIEKESDEEKAA